MTRIQLRRTGQMLAGCSALLIAFAGILWTQFHPGSVSAREAAGSSVLYVSHVRVNEGWQTTLNLTNLESYPIKTTITAYDQKGGHLGDVIAMAGVEETQTIAIDAATLPWGTAAVKIEAEGRLAANAVLRSADGAQAEALPAISATSGRLDFPLLGKGEMSRQTLALFNPNAAAANLEIVAFDRTGYELGRRTLESLGATESRQVVLAEIFAAPGADVDRGERIRKPKGVLSRAASVSLIADQPLVGTQFVETSGADIAALPALTASRDLTFYMPSLSGARELFAGVSLFNPGDQAATFTVEAFDAGANSLGQVAERILAPNATESLRPGSLPEQTAALKVKSDRAISGYESIGVANSQGRTALPGIAAEDQITTGYELIGSSDGHTLEAYPLLKLSDGSVRAGYARVGEDMWAERLGPATGEAQAESAAAQAIEPSFSVSGRLLTQTGAIFNLAGVTMTFDNEFGQGPIPPPAQTNANGEWSQTGFAPGVNYTVTPTIKGFAFTPALRHFNAASTKLDFRAQPFTVSGRVTNIDGTGAKLVKLTFTSPFTSHGSGAVPAPVMTNANGVWSQTGFTSGETYDVTPSHESLAFTPGRLEFDSVSKTLNFTAQTPFKVSGRLLTETGAPFKLAGVTMTFDFAEGRGSVPAPVQTNALGEWSQTGFAPGTTYSVAPGIKGYDFTPASLVFGAASAKLDFSARPFTVSGRVINSDGAGVPSVKLTFTSDGPGAAPAPVATDAKGNWSQTGFESGKDYYIIPSHASYVFTPGRLEFDSARTTLNFVAQAPFSVSGRLLTETGAGFKLAGVTVTFDEEDGEGSVPAPVQTNALGEWSQTGFAPGTTYSAEPSIKGYAFTPASLNFSAASKNINFTVRQFTVSGQVTTSDGAGVPSVKLTFTSGGSGAAPTPVTTDAKGYWSQTGFEGGSDYFLIPSHASYVFTPGRLEFDSTRRTINFKAEAPFKVSGRLLTETGAIFKLAGVTMTFSRDNSDGPTPPPVQTNANGEWSQTGFAPGTKYKVEPPVRGYVFTPSSYEFDNVKTDLSFTLLPFTVSGRVTNSDGAGIPFVKLTFTHANLGAAPAPVTTDAGGAWSQTGFTSGAEYLVTPSHANLAFTPGYLQFDSAGEVPNFTTQAPFSVSGKLFSEAGAGFKLGGVLMTFDSLSGDGPIPAPALTGVNGEWSQTGFDSGTTYSVRPSHAIYAFTPSEILFSAASTKLNFTAQAPFSVSGRLLTEAGALFKQAGVEMTFERVTGEGSIPDNVETNANGEWSQTGFAPGATYRVIPNSDGCVFAPGSLQFSAAGAGLNFRAQTFTLSGRVTNSDGAGLPFVEITFSRDSIGAIPASVMTDDEGNWSQSGFTVGALYRVSPRHESYVFIPKWLEFSFTGKEINFTAR